MTQEADVIIVGGGLSGCALAMALAQKDRKILVLEARAGKNPRFNGELIHPTGVDVLDQYGFLDALHAAGGTDVKGFACVQFRQRPATLLPYRDIPGGRPMGFAIDHHALVATQRALVQKCANVELRLGERVVDVWRKEERVVGVMTAKGPIAAKVVLACDGRHSKLRTVLGLHEHSRLLSFTAAALLEDCELPNPGYGHIFLGAWGPILAYPINARDARTCIDLPAESDDKGTEKIIARIREDYIPALPDSVQPAFVRAMDRGDVEMAANYSMSTDECTVPGAALVGDACGCSHPLTAGGMTVSLNDVRILGRELGAAVLSNPAEVDAALRRYQTQRYQLVRSREVLAQAVYEVFRGADEGTRAVREGIFRYWNGSRGARSRSMALLSGAETRLPAFLREYLTVVGKSTNAVLSGGVNDTSVAGRMRSLAGLGRLSLEKLGQVAKGAKKSVRPAGA